MTLRDVTGVEVSPSPTGFEGLSGTVVPGLVDIQVNGGFGYDFSNDPRSIWEVAARLPRYGVTAFLPTVVSGPVEVAVSALEVLQEGPPSGWSGARPLGLHVEGPMISPQKRGTHPREALIDPDPQFVDTLIKAGPPTMVTIAPELPGAEQAISALTAAGTVVSLGHSSATANEGAAGVSWGATHVTHLLNAMSGLHHRDPGLAAFALNDGRVTVGLIVDGAHLDPVIVDLVYKLKGPKMIALVTDGMSAMGLGDGSHSIGPIAVEVEGVVVRNSEGNLAGSAASYDFVLRTMIATTSCGLADGVTMATATPARIVGYDLPADDLVVLDEQLDVIATMVEGNVLYRRENI